MSAAGTMRRMCAWVPDGGGARLARLRVPTLRATRDVLVRVEHTALNPLDTAMAQGYGRTVLDTLRSANALLACSEADNSALPLGREFVGTVVATGPSASAAPGTRVWGVVPPERAGAHAHYVTVPDNCVGPAPAELGRRAGGALFAALSAAAALAAGGAARGQRVLLLGLGGAGAAALQLLAALPARVTVAAAERYGELALRLGADALVDRHAPDCRQQLERHGPYELVIDAAGVGAAGAGVRCGRFVTLSSPLLRRTDALGLLPGAAAAAVDFLAQNISAASGGTTARVPGVRWAFFRPQRDVIELLRRRAERGEWWVEEQACYEWWRGDEAYSAAAAAGGGVRGKILLDYTARPPPAHPAAALLR